MLQGYRIYDADAHVMLSPRMWESLPAEYVARRPRPVRVADSDGMGIWNNGWLVEGRMQPHPFGPGAQPANTPAMVLEEFGASPGGKETPVGTLPSIASMDLSNPMARIDDMDRMGIDVEFLFPSTLYAHMTSDPGFESALYRAYNRYMGEQCKSHSKRLKWAGLLPMRDQRQAMEAIEEMQALGATAAVVYGTAGERLLSHSLFIPIWDEFARTGLPLCVHMGMSYPPFEELCESIFDAHVLAMCLPAQLAFIAIVGHGMLDCYADLKVAFLEFGAEWILYMVGRIDHYLPTDRGRNMPLKERVPRDRIEDYVKSGRIFVGMEADDPLMTQEMALMGEGQLLYSSDFPHAEARENAANHLLHRTDLSDGRKRKLFYDNAVRLFGEP
jgi:predicted TIM-barrel fold metal-dependent hydrolase